MKTIRRFIYREVILSVAFATLAFLALFFFFDLVDELRWVGRAGLATSSRTRCCSWPWACRSTCTSCCRSRC